MNVKAMKLLGTQAVTVEWEGMAVEVQAQPRAFTGALEKQIQAATSNGEGLALLVSSLVRSWDLTEDETPDSKPYPLTVEALSELPIPFLSSVADALTGVLNPNSPTRSAASAPSS